jgi:8-oxo-dGTP diphosphatase
MVRAPVLAAGGIVLRQAKEPLIAVVRLRKRDEWVLPKGKLDDGETARDAAEREVLEETGHDVSVHEFLGTLVYQSGGRSKVVHYWRMEAAGAPMRELMDDVKAVDWLPLEAALERLSREYERAFLANVGPIALQAAALAETTRRPRTRAKPAPEHRRGRRAASPPSVTEPAPVAPSLAAAPRAPDASPIVAGDAVAAEASDDPAEFELVARSGEASPAPPVATLPSADRGAETMALPERKSLVQKMRDWLRRAA